MKFVRHGSLPVQNIEQKNIEIKRHGSLLPNSIRCIICGPSNCGKTNVMMTLLTHKNGLRYENVYLYTKSLFQPKYQTLGKIMKKVREIGYFPYTDNVKIVKATEAKPNSIFIFDDVACDKQDCMRDYFSMGRHKNVDSFYLCQTYTRIPKHLIRDNANFIILFKQDDINLKHAYDEHVGTDMTFEHFKQFCAQCWKEDYGFVVVDKDSKIGRFRKGFGEFLEWNV